MTNRDQDLRTALEPDHEFKSHPDVFWPAARGEKTFEFRKDDRPGGFHVGQTVRLRCYDRGGYVEVDPLDRRITNILRGGEFGLQEGYCILSLAPLAAPPHPVDAERVEDEAGFLHTAQTSLGWRDTAMQFSRNEDFYRGIVVKIGEMFGEAAKTSDDGSVQQDVLALKVPELVAALLASPAHSPDKAVTRDEVEPSWSETGSWPERIYSAIAEHVELTGNNLDGYEIGGLDDAAKAFLALAPKPTGTEAGRGVIPAGWRLVPEEPTNAMCDVGAERVATGAQWLSARDAYRAMLAATPTPPVSPSPDSTGPAGVEEIGDAPWLAYRKWQDKTKPGYWCESGFRAGYAAGRAALTPSAPIADPSPDSTGQGGAQTERVRHVKRGTEYEVLGEAEAQLSVAVDYTRRDAPARLFLDGEKLTVYRDPKNGKLWCRFTDEFRDGRFITVSQGDAQTQEGGR